MAFIFTVVLLFLFPVRVLAHGEGAVPSDLWTHWNADPLVLMGLLLPIYLYLRGAMTYRISGRRFAAFMAGMGVLLVAMVSPLEALSASLFSGHMLQHILFMLVAAPLIVFSRPAASLLRGLPTRWRKPTAQLTQNHSVHTVWSWLVEPFSIAILHIAVIWLWHLPGLYGLATQYPLVHLIQHTSFFGTAALFWWGIFRTTHYGSGVLSAFIVMMSTGLLGALMTFSTTGWYTAHENYVGAWGLTLLEDQQLAGLLMWVPSGFGYVIAAGFLLSSWLNSVEQKVLKNEHQIAKGIHDA